MVMQGVLGGIGSSTLLGNHVHSLDLTKVPPWVGMCTKTQDGEITTGGWTQGVVWVWHGILGML